MGYKNGTQAQSLVPSKVLVLWATEASQPARLSHDIAIVASATSSLGASD
jgi:hypothetical protein